MQIKLLFIDKLLTRLITMIAVIILAGCAVTPARHAPRYHAAYPKRVIIYR